jgi:hypothetical protein
MKKIIAAILLGLIALPLFAGERQIKKDRDIDEHMARIAVERDKYRGFLGELGYKKSEIKAISNKGYSPYAAYLYLRMARESGVPVSRIIVLREHGLSNGEICEKVKLNYARFMDETDREAIEKNIEFPAATGEERAVDTASMPKTEVQE